MSERKPARYTVTSALPYANGPLHIGQIAGAYLPADIYVRYLRLRGEDVVYICGSDEHGAAITIKAIKEGTTPQEIVDKYHELNKVSFKWFGIDFDIYHRTSSELHHETAREFFTALNDKGEFTVEETEQYYDEEKQQFLADRYIIGTCPKCGFDKAYGDQCENCGSSLGPTELINPKSTLSGNEPVLRKTKHWYLPMQKYEDWLKEWILVGHKEWKKNVYGACKSWLEQGLQPRAMTRDLDWGVKVPLPDAEGKVLYVWLDAPIGYISATKQWAIDNDKDWKPYWQDKDTKLVHFIGKDNIVFHCIIFPIILKAKGGYILPDNVPANEFLNMKEGKMSTSRNYAVWLHEYLEEFPGKQDVLRYALTANMPETKDSEFGWDDYQARNNNELVAILGNFVNRTLVLTQKYFDGKVPELDESLLDQEDKALLEQINVYSDKVSNSIEAYRFREALNEMMNLARAGNKYLTDKEPWKLIKTDEDRVRNILNISLQVIANLAILFEPFLPFTTRKLLPMLNLDEEVLDWYNLGRKDLLLKGHQLNKPELLFEKVEDEVVQKQLEKLNKGKEQPPSPFPPIKENIDFNDFTKLDLRVATIREAEKVPKTDKLLKLKLDVGLEERTVLSGIAEYFKPEDIIGKQVCLVANLAPKKIRGIESKGMILMAENEKGELAFVSPTQAFPAGAVVR